MTGRSGTHALPGDGPPGRSGSPPAPLLDLPFGEPDLLGLREAVAAHAHQAGLPATRVPQLVLIAYELATNAVRHGGGRGRLRLWRGAAALHCQVADRGPGLPDRHRAAPLRPPPGAPGGRGLWLAYTFADRLELTNRPDGGAEITATVTLP